MRLFHTRAMLPMYQRGRGMTPGKGGEWVDEKFRLRFGQGGRRCDGCKLHCDLRSGRFAADSMYEAADAGIPLIVCITKVCCAGYDARAQLS